MRALVAALGVLLPLTSCMPMAAPAYGPQRYDTALRARLTPAGLSAISFYVNQPAYVAVFEITPGNAIQMLYPRYGADAMAARAGSHTVWRTSHRYASSSWGSGMHSFSRWGARGAYAFQPRIFYLVASERPLRVSPWMGSPLALQNALMGAMMGRSQYSLMEEVTRLVVPNYADRNWVSDVYVEWPEPGWQGLQPTPTRVIVCADGRRFVVPAYITSCPRDLPAAPPVDSVAPDDEPQRQRPERRRPEREGATPSGETGAAPAGGVRPERGARPDRAREPQRRPATEPSREARPPRQEPSRETRPARPERGATPAARPTRESPPPRERPASPPARSTDRSPPARSAEPSRPPRAEPSATRGESSSPRAQPAARPEREDRSSGSD